MEKCQALWLGTGTFRFELSGSAFGFVAINSGRIAGENAVKYVGTK
jgi:hypothetical protein